MVNHGFHVVGKYTSPMDAMGITICMIPACLIPDNLQTNKPQARSSWWLLTSHPAWWYLGAAGGDAASGSTGSRICRTGEVSCDDTLRQIFFRGNGQMKDFIFGRVFFCFFLFRMFFFARIFFRGISVVGNRNVEPSGTRWSHHHTWGHGTTPGGMTDDSQTNFPPGTRVAICRFFGKKMQGPKDLLPIFSEIRHLNKKNAKKGPIVSFLVEVPDLSP